MTLNASAFDQAGEVVGEEDVVETVTDPAAPEAAGPWAGVEGWERSRYRREDRSDVAHSDELVNDVADPWAWCARFASPPPPDWLLK